jgi:hypothetical protein
MQSWTSFTSSSCDSPWSAYCCKALKDRRLFTPHHEQFLQQLISTIEAFQDFFLFFLLVKSAARFMVFEAEYLQQQVVLRWAESSTIHPVDFIWLCIFRNRFWFICFSIHAWLLKNAVTCCINWDITMALKRISRCSNSTKFCKHLCVAMSTVSSTSN